MVNNLVDSSGIAYQGDNHIMEAKYPWGPWYTVGEDLSQSTWNFGPQPLLASYSGSSSPWTLNEAESGYFLLEQGQTHPDANGYSEGTRALTVTSSAPNLAESQLDKDMNSVGGLYWLYDGEWHINNPDNWYTIKNNSSYTHNLTNEQYSAATGTWNNETATYSKDGFAGLTASMRRLWAYLRHPERP